MAVSVSIVEQKKGHSRSHMALFCLVLVFAIFIGVNRCHYEITLGFFFLKPENAFY